MVLLIAVLLLISRLLLNFIIPAYNKRLIDCKNCVCRKAGGRDWLTVLEVLMGKRPEVNFSVLINQFLFKRSVAC